MLQQLFDACYMTHAFSTNNSEQGSRDAILDVIQAAAQELKIEDSASDRIRKSAREYWKRTYLLFGLLASSSQT